jgi:outer membrane protein assembly factor BamB
LFGDEQLVFAVPHGETSARVFARIDGRELGQRKVPPLNKRWATVDRKILTWEQSNGSIRLFLFDPWRNEEVWSHSFDAGMKGQLLEREGQFAALQPDGRFRVIELETGHERIDESLEPLSDLEAIQVVTYVDHYLLFTTRPRASAARRPTNVVLVNGPVYAFDRRTGQPVWPAPAYLDDYLLPPGQPRDLPLMAMLQNRTVKQANRASRTRTSLLVIDRRDGRQVFQRDLGKSSSNVQLVSADADERTSIAAVLQGGMTFRLTLGAAPWSPAPPVETGNASSLTTGPASSKMADAAGNAIKAIGRLAKEILESNPAEDPFGGDGGAKP